MKCQNCGKQNPRGAKFCGYCQYELKKEKEISSIKFYRIVTAICVVAVCIMVAILTIENNTSSNETTELFINVASSSVPSEPVETLSNLKAPIISVEAGYHFITAVHSDGRVSVVCEDEYSTVSDEISKWNNITAVSVGENHIVGLKEDGTVISTDRFHYPETGNFVPYDPADWTDIIAIAAGNDFTIGLKSDNTLVAAGNNNYGQCDVQDLKQIKEISAEKNVLLCLTMNEKFIRLGETGPVGKEITRDDVSGISQVDCTPHYTFFYVKKDRSGHEDVYCFFYEDKRVSSWPNADYGKNRKADIVKISAANDCLFILYSDGSTEYREYTRVPSSKRKYDEDFLLPEWQGIIDIACGAGFAVGLKEDGTVVTVGNFADTGAKVNVSKFNDEQQY